MNPIPLTDPDGRTFAFACGKCFHVSAGSTLLWWEPDHDGPHPQLVEASRSSATMCCRCILCRVAEITKNRDGATFASRSTCDACMRKQDERLAWTKFCWSWHRIGEAYEMGFSSISEWKEYDESHDE